MDFTNKIQDINYEEKLPILQVSTEELYLSLSPSTIYTGAFTIDNQGGGQLQGFILSSHPYLTCDLDQWEGNKQVCMYRIDTKGMNVSQMYECSFTILSNGGEKVIPIWIIIEESEGFNIEKREWHDLETFANYAKNHWSEAMDYFHSKEFSHWLQQDFSSWISLYQYVKNQSADRALESFLVGGGWKKPVQWSLINTDTYIRITEGQKRDLEYVVEIQQEHWGYTEGIITTNVDWIQLWKDQINSEELDQQGRGYIPYRIIPNAFKKRYQCGYIFVDTPYQRLKYEVTGIKNPTLDIQISQKSFYNEDKGEILIINNTGEDLVIHIRPNASWVQFEAKKYLISQKASIPFTIHFTKWNQFLYKAFFSQGIFHKTQIIVQTVVNKKGIKKEFTIMVGPEI